MIRGSEDANVNIRIHEPPTRKPEYLQPASVQRMQNTEEHLDIDSKSFAGNLPEINEAFISE